MAADHLAQCTSSATPCDRTLVEQCGKLSSLLQPSITNGLGACLRGSCDKLPIDCVREGIASVRPSQSQKNLATKFCGDCIKQPGEACETAFFASIGAPLLPLSDSIADAVAGKCMVPLACVGAFPACAQAVVAKELSGALAPEAVTCLATALTPKPPSGDAGPPPESDTGPTPTDAGVDTAVPPGDSGTLDDASSDSAPPPTTCKGEIEPNDTIATARNVASSADCDWDSKPLEGVLSSKSDVDYYRYVPRDDLLCATNPRVTIAGKSRVCSFMRCGDGSYAKFTCVKGERNNIDGISMCCETEGTVQLAVSCPGSYEGASMYLRVDSAVGVCTPYKVDYHF